MQFTQTNNSNNHKARQDKFLISESINSYCKKEKRRYLDFDISQCSVRLFQLIFLHDNEKKKRENHIKLLEFLCFHAQHLNPFILKHFTLSKN